MAKNTKARTRGKESSRPQSRQHRSLSSPKPVSWPTAFPDRYGETYFLLIDVDPHTLFASWEIDEMDLERGQLALCGDTQLVIRVYDVTYIIFDGGNAHSYFDVVVKGKAHSWYIHPWMDGRSLIADIGLRGGTGFVALARSNCVQMPRTGEDPHGIRKWLYVEGHPQKHQLVADEASLPSRYVGTSMPIVPTSLADLRPKELMDSIAREDVVRFYRVLWQGDAGHPPPQETEKKT